MKEKYLMLKNIADNLIKDISLDFKRDIYENINWDDKIIGLIGERGVGKTTIMLQKLNENKKGFYFSADNPIAKNIGLFNFIYFLNHELNLEEFYIDEIHKYSDWTSEIKSIYDSFPNVKIVFSGSSSLDLYKGILDLSRRVSFYKIHTMNYKEYLKLYHNIDIPNFSLDEILTRHIEIALKYGNIHKITYFEDFIKRGQYPYLKEFDETGHIAKFQNLLDKIIIEDLPVFVNLQTTSLDKLRKLVYFIANSTPSELSFTNLSKKVGVDKVIVENVLVLLSKIGIISLIPKFGNLSDRVRKEYKIFLGNTNLYNAYNLSTEIGILRESFFISQVKRIENIEIFTPKLGDFTLQIYDKVFHFEIGGKNKNSSKYSENIYIIKDDITIGENERIIPLWLFGLLK
ncbi:MAG: ATP-binding protein [Candidatus Altimarinota bacterium]